MSEATEYWRDLFESAVYRHMRELGYSSTDSRFKARTEVQSRQHAIDTIKRKQRASRCLTATGRPIPGPIRFWREFRLLLKD